MTLIEHVKVMAYTHKEIIETEGSPQMYVFRQNDSLESRDGEWYLQVTQAKPRTSNDVGQVGFTLYSRVPPHEGLSAGIWRKHSWHVTDQASFVDLLKTGHCQALSLSSMEDEALGISKDAGPISQKDSLPHTDPA